MRIPDSARADQSAPRSPSISTNPKQPDQPGRQAIDNWSFLVSSAFLYGELPTHLQRAVQIVELRLRSGWFTWASPKKLAAEYGCRLRNWQIITAEMVRRGWWLVIKLDPDQKKTLTIIIALRRIDEQKGTFTPGVNTLESIRETVRLRTGQRRRLPMEYVERPPAESAQSVAQNRAADCAESRNGLRDLQNPLPFEEGLKSNTWKENATKTTTTSCDSAPPHAREPSSVRSSSSSDLSLSCPSETNEPEKPLSVDQPLIASDELAEFDTWSDELSLSPERRRDFLAACGPHGPRLGTACLKFARRLAKTNPHRFAETARDGWRRKLAGGEMTLGDVEAEVGSVALSGDRRRQRELDSEDIERSVAAQEAATAARRLPTARHTQSSDGGTPKDAAATIRAMVEHIKRGNDWSTFRMPRTETRQDRPQATVDHGDDGSTVPTPEDSSGDDSDPFAGISARARGPPLRPGTA